MPVKQWNFRKAKWSHHIALTNKFAKTLLPLIHLIWMRLTRTSVTPLREQPKRLFLYRTFLQSSQGDNSSLAATASLAKLDRKRRDRWSEAVRSIDFSHSSRKAWSILNNLIGRSRYSPRHVPFHLMLLYLN